MVIVIWMHTNLERSIVKWKHANVMHNSQSPAFSCHYAKPIHKKSITNLFFRVFPFPVLTLTLLTKSCNNDNVIFRIIGMAWPITCFLARIAYKIVKLCCSVLLLLPFFPFFWTFANSQISRIISLSIIQTTTGAFFRLKALFIFLLFKNRFSLFRLHLVCRYMHERLVSISLSCDEMMRSSSSSLWIYPLYFSCTLKKITNTFIMHFLPIFLLWPGMRKNWMGGLITYSFLACCCPTALQEKNNPILSFSLWFVNFLLDFILTSFFYIFLFIYSFFH